MSVSRARLRDLLARGTQAIGTFVKLPSLDVIDLAAAAGLDFIVVDLEHSQLSSRKAGELVRHAALIDLPALVRIPAVDPALVNRLLEAGAAGLQLSMLLRQSQNQALRAASRYPPHGTRSVSLSHSAAGFGAAGLKSYLASEHACPPVLVGQVERPETEDPLDSLLTGLDVAFIGTTDMSAEIGLDAEDMRGRLRGEVKRIGDAAERAGARLGGWVSGADEVAGLGLETATYLVVGTDIQCLQAGMRSSVTRLRESANAKEAKR